MLKALVLILTAGLAAKMSGEEWTRWRAARMSTKEVVRFLQWRTSGGQQKQRENMLLSHPTHHNPPLPFLSMTLPISCCYSREAVLSLAFNFKVYTPRHILSFLVCFTISLLFNQYFPFNLVPPCFVGSSLIPPIFFSASSPTLHLFSSESCYLRDMKGTYVFLSRCSSQVHFTPRPGTLKGGSSLPALYMA